ncbi:MAG: hypothetical protein LCH39_02735 [Proteobacteria bacterium]|nr:hypothetical protein [Pseudomonadota bacterium]
MMYLFDAAGYQETLCAPEGLTCGGQGVESSRKAPSTVSSSQGALLESDELLAAYVAREPHVPSMLRLLLDMSEEQRRLSLAMLQSVSAGNFLASSEAG